MSLPERVQQRVGEERVTAELSLGGEDSLVVTPSELLVYRAQGLLSDESVVSHSHDAERITVSDGRRKSKITLDYGIDGEESIKLPADRTNDALRPIIAAVLSTANVTEDSETPMEMFRFSDLLLIVTDDRIVKHVGAAVWDEDYEEFAYEDIDAVDFEEGTVATSVVLQLSDRRERFKTPNERVRPMRKALTEAICEFHDVGSLEELRSLNESESDEDSESGDGKAAPTDFGVGPDPLSASPAGVESTSDPDDGQKDEMTLGSGMDLSGSEAGSQPANELSESDSKPDPTSAPGSGENKIDRSRAASGDKTSTAEAESDRGSEADHEEDTSQLETDISGQQKSVVSAAVGSGTDDDSAFEFTKPERADLVEEVAALNDTVERQGEQIEQQGEQIERQSEYIKQLIEELRRGR